MRVHIAGRDGLPITAIADSINAACAITYETVLPGGMSMAACSIPWRGGKRAPRLFGASFVVRDGIDCVWWGRIHDVTERVDGQAQYLDLVAVGPWALAAKSYVNADYVSGGSWTGTDMLKTAVYGHMEDVVQRMGGDVGPAYDVGALAWSDSTVQQVIAECLRIGDDTVSSWNFVVWPPVFAPAGSFTWSSDCDAVADFTAQSGATISNLLYHRGGTCLRLLAAAGGAAYAYQDVSAAATYYASMWLYMAKTRPAEEHDHIIFWEAGTGNRILSVRTGATHIWEIRNEVAGATYTATGNQAMSAGSWHHVAAQCTANGAAGVAKLWLDGQLIINQTSLNTGANNITRVYYGDLSNGAADRYWFIDDTIISTAALDMDQTVTSETLPEPRIVKMNRTDYDFMISLARVQQSAFTRSLRTTTNNVRTTYGSGSWGSIYSDADSVARYGQLLSLPSLTRTASGTVANYLSARYLERWKEPAAMLQPVALTTPPSSRGGGIMPLSRIKAGMVFAIRERPDLGVFYVGGTRYRARGAGQAEVCEITPIEPAYDLATAVALREQRTMT
jgi:hypothetical protein